MWIGLDPLDHTYTYAGSIPPPVPGSGGMSARYRYRYRYRAMWLPVILFISRISYVLHP